MRVNSELQTHLNSQKTGVRPAAQNQQRALRNVQADVHTNAAETDTRGISNVLTIMQKAQLIVQRALTVSSRLQNAAMETYSGQTDFDQIGAEISTINASLEEFGADVTTPAVSQTVNRDQLRANLTQMNEMVQNRNIGSTEINAVYSSLQEQSYAVDTKLSSYQKQNGINPNPDAGQTAASIQSSPSSALSVQGNIIPDSVSKLT